MVTLERTQRTNSALLAALLGDTEDDGFGEQLMKLQTKLLRKRGLEAGEIDEFGNPTNPDD